MNELTDREFEELLAEANDGTQQEASLDGKSLQDARAITEALKAAKKKSSLKERKAEKQRRQQLIISNAINDTFIDLNAPVSTANKQWLIAKYTEKYTISMQKQQEWINNVATLAFKKLIPRRLLNTWRLNPDMCIPFPGFMYTASEEYGEGLSFKIEVDLPYYFEPEDCEAILKECCGQLNGIDKSIANFYNNKKVRAEREIKAAEQLMRVSNFFDLVKLNPDWYLLLREELWLQYEKKNYARSK